MLNIVNSYLSYFFDLVNYMNIIKNNFYFDILHKIIRSKFYFFTIRL